MLRSEVARERVSALRACGAVLFLRRGIPKIPAHFIDCLRHLTDLVPLVHLAVVLRVQNHGFFAEIKIGRPQREVFPQALSCLTVRSEVFQSILLNVNPPEPWE